MITAFGETKCLFDWGKDERCALTDWGLRTRYRSGQWADMEAMIITPLVDKKISQVKMKSNRMLQAFGESKCLNEWVRDPRCLVKIDTFRDRLNKGWDIEKILTTAPTRTGFAKV